MSATGRGPSRVHRDDYPTPAWCTRALIRHLGEDKPPTRILEPCAGEGAIIAVLREFWPTSEIYAIELDKRRAARCRKAHGVTVVTGDFLKASLPTTFDLVATNPPYGSKLLMRIIRRSIALGSQSAQLLPIPWMFGGNGRIEFRRELPFDVLSLGRRPQFMRHVLCGKDSKDSCGWDDWYAIDGDWPRVCPKCRRKTRSSTSDSTEYGWMLHGPGRGGRWFQAELDADERGPLVEGEED